MFLSRAKKWIVPGSTICVLCALNFLFSSYFLSKDCLKDLRMVSMRAKENYTGPIASSQVAIERYINSLCPPTRTKLSLVLVDGTTVLPAKSYSDVMLCLQSYQGLIIDKSLCINPISRIGLLHK